MQVGIIGAGHISTFHAAAYRALEVDITAVCDVNKEQYLSKKDLYGDAEFYDNIDDLLCQGSVDAISVCVGNKLHAGIVSKAIAAGKHIFCEKTMTENEEKSAALLDLLNNYDKNFQIGYMKRFYPATQKVVELLPEIGEVFSAYIRSYQAFDWDFDIYDCEWYKPIDGQESLVKRLYGGAALNQAGSHMLDLMNLFLDLPMRVYAANWAPKEYDCDISSHALFTLPNAGVVHFDVCVSPYSRGGIRQDGWDETVQINGTKGRIEVFYSIWDKPMGNAPMVRYYSEQTKSYTEFTFRKMDAFQAEVDAFVANCKSGQKSIPGANEGYIVDKLISACYRSAEHSEIIDL